jgi:hypothetical protein
VPTTSIIFDVCSNTGTDATANSADAFSDTAHTNAYTNTTTTGLLRLRLRRVHERGSGSR